MEPTFELDFNPIIVRFKPSPPPPLPSPIFHFNPIIVRFKLILIDPDLANNMLFQSYNSSIQTDSLTVLDNAKKQFQSYK